MIDKVAPQEQAKPAESAPTATATAQTAQKQTTYAANAAVTSAQSTNGGIVLSNGNTAGEQGSYAAARMAEMTGVPASTWEAIIARESNGQVNAANASGASGLFQTMPGWGSTATVDDQSRLHTMHIAHKVYQLGVIKKIGLQFVNLFF